MHDGSHAGGWVPAAWDRVMPVIRTCRIARLPEPAGGVSVAGWHDER